MISFNTDNRQLKAAVGAALAGLERNVHVVDGHDGPVLFEGAEYPGIWLESGPLSGLIYGAVDPQIALDNHRIFFQMQRQDGYLPCWIRADRLGTAQIQMVVPVAATAFEAYRATGDYQFLEEAYSACVGWDAWLSTHRNSRMTGLCEAFCEFDTGHDNSPRWSGMPNECPEGDARICPEHDGLPYLAPDLSATLFGGRRAMAKMARVLRLDSEALAWEERAACTRYALMKYCFDPESVCFYDLTSHDRFVRIRGDALTRVLGEHVVDQDLFEQIYRRHIRNPDAFWTPYPLPSIAADDPAFVRELPVNSWGGAAQALSALRAPRWFEHYGKYVDLIHLMTQWIRALCRDYQRGYRQQLNPWTGDFTSSPPGYSPAMLVMIDFVARLYGIRGAGDTLQWTCQVPDGASEGCFTLDTPHQRSTMIQDSHGAMLCVDNHQIARVAGACRLYTDLHGVIHTIVGITSKPEAIEIDMPGRPRISTVLYPDSRVNLG